MPNGPNVAGMIADPDFQGLAPADKRAALTKLTGDQSFSSLNDGETMQFVSRFPKAPTPTPSAFTSGDFQTMPGSPIYNPATLGSQALPYASPGAAVSGAMARGQMPDFPQQVQQSGSNAAGYAVPIGATVGAIGGVPGMALGAGMGKIAEARMRGQPSSPTDVALTTGLTAATGKAAEMAGPLIGKGVQKLLGESPERIAELQTLFPKEKSLEMAVNQAEEDSRAAFHAAYPKIDASPVDMASAKGVATQGIKEMRAIGSVPQAAAKVANVPTLSMEDALNSNNLAEFYQKLDQVDKIPFRQAQDLRTSVEGYITRNRPTGTTYEQLKGISKSLSDAMESTAKQEGVLPQFQQANALFKQHAADFWNKGAPLRDYLPIQKGGKVIADQEGQTINRFLNTANQSRALDALQRRGVPTDTIKAILSKGSDSVKADIADAVTLKNLGPDVLNRQVAGPARKEALKYGAGALGVGAPLADYLYHAMTRRNP
jgi:hypothetical protein